MSLACFADVGLHAVSICSNSASVVKLKQRSHLGFRTIIQLLVFLRRRVPASVSRRCLQQDSKTKNVFCVRRLGFCCFDGGDVHAWTSAGLNISGRISLLYLTPYQMANSSIKRYVRFQNDGNVCMHCMLRCDDFPSSGQRSCSYKNCAYVYLHYIISAIMGSRYLPTGREAMSTELRA